MPSAEIDILRVSKATRLRRFNPYQATEMELATMLPWYSDHDTARLVDGPGAQPYDLDKLTKMFRYLHDHGELYLIECLEAGRWNPVGDVTPQRTGLPIVLAPTARNQGIGRAVIGTLIERARTLKWRKVEVNDIYSYNHQSRRMFEGLGFVQGEPTDHGHRYSLQLTTARSCPVEVPFRSPQRLVVSVIRFLSLQVSPLSQVAERYPYVDRFKGETPQRPPRPRSVEDRQQQPQGHDRGGHG